jgi:CheY-like chemotaxis protein
MMISAIIIDDDQDNVDLFSEFLEIIQIKTLGHGNNGLHAVDLYEKHRPDIVFLDLLMPDYDGFYALENIRNIDPNAFIVVITAVIDKKSRQMLEELRPDYIIQKPFEPEHITEVISNFNQRQKQSVSH